MEFQFDKNIETYEGKSYYITAHDIIIDNFEKTINYESDDLIIFLMMNGYLSNKYLDQQNRNLNL